MDTSMGTRQDPEREAGPTSKLKPGDYTAWRDRMFEKKDRQRATIGLAPGESEPSEQMRARPLEWEFEAGPDLVISVNPAAYAVLDLRQDATEDQIIAAYRKLAKRHHPDNWAHADVDIREHHERCMSNINAAYRALMR